MSFNFVIPQFNINGAGTPPFQFYRRGFILNGTGGSQPSWKDIILKGVTALTLVNAKANGLNYLKLFGDTEQLAETYIDSVTLGGKCGQSGTPTPTVPVDIVCNNGAIKYSANMCNVNAQTASVGYYISTQGVVTADIYNWIYQDFIPVKPNTTYTLTMSSPVYYVSISEYSTADDSGFVVRKTGSTGSNTTLTITTGLTTNYIRFGTNLNRTAVTLDAVLAIDWMLNMGATALPYTPYVEDGIYIDGTVEIVTDNVGNVATAERLLSVGDYKDTQEVLSGAVTRNVRVLVLDGTEFWQLATGSGYRQFYTTDTQGVIAGSVSLASNIAPYGCTASTRANYDYGCYSGGSGNLCFQMRGSSTLTSVQTWIDYLSDQYANGTPVIVVYPTSSATTESVTPQFLLKEPLTVTGSLTDLVANVVSSSHTTPTPTHPLPINTNNGMLKVSPNLFNKNSYTEINAYVNSNTGVLTQGSPGEMTQYCAVIPCLPNTTYTISGRVNSAWGAFTSSNIGTTATSFNKTENGSITTGANDKYLIGLVRANNNVIDYRNTLQVEQGSTATPYKPYGQVYVDGTVETVEVTGKNLNGGGELDNKGYTSTGGTSTSTTFCGTLWKIKVKAGEKYTVSYGNFPNGISGVFVNTWKTDGTWNLRQAISISSAYTYTIPAGIGEVNFTLYKTGGITIASNSWLQVEKGDTATDYEPYFNGGTATAEMLLKVGDYQDVQSVLDGVVTRKVGIKIFDGTENWASGTRGYYVAIPNKWQDRGAVLICTHFKYSTSTLPNIPDNSIMSFGTPSIGISMDTIASLNDFKAFLASQYNAGTPVVVVYPLQTPTTETVTAQPLTIQAGTNIVEITQASMDNLELEVSYKAGVSVTVTEIENAQLDNSVEVTVNG